jgi:Zn-dependent M28 family amino/carboxypeptidase
MKSISALLIGLLAFSACAKTPVPGPAAEEITPAEIDAHIRFLSDDLLEGRSLGGRGHDIAALYQETRFREFGLEAAFADGSYRQMFDLRGCAPDPQAGIELLGTKSRVPLASTRDFVVKSHRSDIPAAVEGGIVYAGYLIQAPEREWDDIKGLDLKGKIILCEINEPGNARGGIFDGEDMTYYGRWPYKFEKAAELGALGCLIIHDTKGAAYGFEVVQNSWLRENFFLPDKPQLLAFQGWISGEAAERILAAVGIDRAAVRAKAERSDFAPIPLGARARVRQKPAFRTVPVMNVAAIRRAKPAPGPERYIVFSAHYDHLGRNADLAGDQIFNGAVDNCSASATLLALARFYARTASDPEVGLIFAAVTAEEELMLGSDYFARHLPVPAGSILADLNLEMTNVWGETEDVYTIGGKHSDLDGIAARAAANLGLRYIPERNGELGFFFRSDQVSFARNGIPSVWLHEGVVSKFKGPDYMPGRHADYQKNKYHKPADEIEADWDYRGTIQIARWAREIVSLLAAGPVLPQFKPTSSFRRK